MPAGAEFGLHSAFLVDPLNKSLAGEQRARPGSSCLFSSPPCRSPGAAIAAERFQPHLSPLFGVGCGVIPDSGGFCLIRFFCHSCASQVFPPLASLGSTPFSPFGFFLRSRRGRVAPEPSGSGLSLLPKTDPEPPPLPAPNPRKMPHLSPLPTSCPSAQPGEAETPKGPTLTPLLPP